MAGNHPFLTKLRAILRSLDDDALASLANKGLLRRARKDLEALRPTILATDADNVQVLIEDATVTVPELPAKSRCTCPATGICRHILAALVYLRDDSELAALDQPMQGELSFGPGDQNREGEAPAESLHPTPADVLGAVTDEELQKWAGKALFRKAAKALAAGPLVEIEAGATLVVRFPARNITCRWIPSNGLVGLVCSCQAETVCEHVVTAVLAYQASLGKRQVTREESSLEASSGAPRTRDEVLASVGAVLREMIGLGLARLSAATSQRLTTLAVSAHGVDLPRLERMLAGLAKEIDLTLRRDAQASTTTLLMQAAKIEALRAALVQNQSLHRASSAGAGKSFAALVGQHRTSYFEVGQLTLHGMGAQHWRSKGGYHGITVYFWDEAAKTWATWSETRPVDQAGFHPISRYRGDGPWAGCNSPYDASRSVVRVTGAFRNADGRISGRPATRALVAGPTLAKSVCPRIQRWTELAPLARKLFGSGLAGASANQELVLLAPTTWEPAQYDQVRQELVRPVVDADGRVLSLWLPFTPENESAVELLEQHDGAATWGVLGALRLLAGRLIVQPISLLSDEEVISLNLDKAQPTAAGTAQQPREPDDETLADDDSLDSPLAAGGPATALSRLLVTAQAELESLAENGLSARRDLTLLGNIARRLEALGLSVCSVPLQRLMEQMATAVRLADPAERATLAGTLLAAYYILRLAGDQESVAAALAGVA
jgi:hypothetical protein